MTKLECAAEPQEIILTRPYRRDSGHAWKASIAISGDSVTLGGYTSDLVLFENDNKIGPSHTSHGSIRDYGAGRYSHWQNDVYFSSTDNSDPNTNGRTYRAVVTPRDPYLDMANFALKTAQSYLYMARLKMPDINSLSVFELGPGDAMGASMAMATYGAKVHIKELKPLQWIPELHGKIAERMLDVLAERGQAHDPKPLRHALETGETDPSSIQILNQDRDVIAQDILKGTIDFTCSNAVLEHVADLKAELTFLHKISKTGSFGYHTVDFRDHHHMEEPLEFLLESDEDFVKSCDYLYSRGNRMRYDQFVKTANEVGFAVHEIERQEASQEYLDAFLPRLRTCETRFKDLPVESLKTTQAFIMLEKL